MLILPSCIGQMHSHASWKRPCVKGIPYKIYGGLSFYQRKEVKDVISYLRLIVNPHDEEAFKRGPINYPARGIGDTTLNKLVVATDHNVQFVVRVERSDPGTLCRSITVRQKKLSDFRELISGSNGILAFSAEEIAAAVVKRERHCLNLFQDRSVEGNQQQENLQGVAGKVLPSFAVDTPRVKERSMSRLLTFCLKSRC